MIDMSIEAEFMGTVASSAGIADLLQTLTSVGSPLASTLSSPALQSALQNASPADIVKLSDQALQLQETDALFGVPDSTDSSGSSDIFNSSSLLASLFGSTASSSGTPSPTSNSPESAQLAAAQSELQAEQAALFTSNTDASSSGSLLNVLG